MNSELVFGWWNYIFFIYVIMLFCIFQYNPKDGFYHKNVFLLWCYERLKTLETCSSYDFFILLIHLCRRFSLWLYLIQPKSPTCQAGGKCSLRYSWNSPSWESYKGPVCCMNSTTEVPIFHWSTLITAQMASVQEDLGVWEPTDLSLLTQHVGNCHFPEILLFVGFMALFYCLGLSKSSLYYFSQVPQSTYLSSLFPVG